MNSRLQRKCRTAVAVLRSNGFVGTVRRTVEQIFVSVLYHIFHFDPWHATAPKSSRAYRMLVASMANEVGGSVVVEVGCGLGFILGMVTASERIGYDLDHGAVKAARLIHGHGCQFKVGSADAVCEKRIDVLILVNWPHALAPRDLDEALAPLLPKTRYLIMDAIDPNGPNYYKYKHDFAFLCDKARKVKALRTPNDQRTFYLFQVNA